MRAGDEDFDLRARFADIDDKAANAIARFKLFTGNLLVAAHECFSAVDLDDESLAFITLCDADDDLIEAL